VDRVDRFGRVTFALGMAAFGVQHLLFAVVGGPAPGPPWGPIGRIGAGVIGAALVVASVGLATGKKVRLVAMALTLLLVVRAAVVYLPMLVTNIRDPGPWTSGLELLAFAGALLVLTGAFHWRFLFAIPLAGFGTQHLMYPKFVATLVPSWIPGQLFWAYAVGIAFIAAAVAISANRHARPAAIALGTMFLSWILVLHGPRVLGALHNGNEWTSLLVAFAMGGASFIVAGAAAPTRTARDPRDHGR